MRLFEGFAGLGAVTKALTNIGVPCEVVGYSEIDKWANVSYSSIHGVSTDLNYGDIYTIDEKNLPQFDLFTFGSPCQDFSVAGKQKGSVWTCTCGAEYNPLDIHWSKRDVCPCCGGTHRVYTRSSLLTEGLRIIRHTKPKYLLMENVKNLVGKRFMPSFQKVIQELGEYGYNTYYKVINAKDFQLPQNRERVFVVCIRKDIDKWGFEFPQGSELMYKLSDFLEEHVAKEYYLKDSIVARLKSLEEGKRKPNIIPTTSEVCRTITTRIANQGNWEQYIQDNVGIRMFTDRECFRLMGFSEADYSKVVQANVPKSQRYKQAGNSIAVPVLEGIFRNLFNL